MKPTLFVDFDGTLCHDRFWRSADKKVIRGIQKLLFGVDGSRVDDWMRGRYASEEINRFLAEKLNIPFEKLWGIFVSDCKSMNVSADVLNKIEILRARYNTVLITGNMDCFTRFTIPTLGLDGHFDQIFNSADHGKFKDDDRGKIFMGILDKSNSNIKNSFLIDDSKTTCETFSGLGGKPLRVTNTTPAEYWLDYLNKNTNI